MKKTNGNRRLNKKFTNLRPETVYYYFPQAVLKFPGLLFVMWTNFTMNNIKSIGNSLP